MRRLAVRCAAGLGPTWIIAALARAYAPREMALLAAAVASLVTVFWAAVASLDLLSARRLRQRLARLDAELAIAHARRQQELELRVAAAEDDLAALTEAQETEERQQAEQIYWSQVAEQWRQEQTI